MKKTIELLKDNYDKKGAIITVSSLVLMTVYLYQGHKSFFMKHFSANWADHPFLDWFQYIYLHGAAFICLGLIPLLIVLFWLKEKPADYGVRLGDWRFGLKFMAVALVIVPISGYVTAGGPDFQAEYPLTKLAGLSVGYFMLWELTYLVYYIAWEFMYRGYLQFGLQKQIGLFYAIMLQTGLSSIMHIGKPEGETMSAIAGGVIMGLLAARTRSLLWPLLFHWYLGASVDFFSLIRSGNWHGW